MAKARKRLAAALDREQPECETLLGTASNAVHETMRELHDLLAAALERGADTCNHVRANVVEKAKAADSIVRDNPYRTIGIALGVGTLVGHIASSRHCAKRA